MSETSPGNAAPGAAGPEITAWIAAWRQGDAAAGDRLVEALYGELHRMAGRRMRGERHRLTLPTTALVHETYLRLAGAPGEPGPGNRRVEIQDRNHFLALAAIAMRRVLVDRARERNADKRGGGVEHVALEETIAAGLDPSIELLDIDRALRKLETDYPRPARVVELKFFGGLEEAEIADVTGTSIRTVRRDWSFASAWLERELAAHRP